MATDKAQVMLRLDAEQLALVDAARGDAMSRNAYIEWALGKVRQLRLVPTPSTGETSSRAAVAGFKGSELPGHRDVPELGWYRPSSAEAKAGVEVDKRLLEAAKSR